MTIEMILRNQCELIQDNLITLLDGLDDEFVDAVCQMIVDRFDIIKESIDNE